MVFLGGEKNKKNEKSLKTGNQYHVTGTIGSNLTYLATQDKFPWVFDCSLETQSCPQNLSPDFFFILAMSKCMVSMATHNAILLNGGVPTKTTITRLLFSLDY